MEVRKIWRVQFLAAWALLVAALLVGAVLVATVNFALGCAVIIAGMVIEIISGFLMWKMYRCPKCGLSLNRRMLGGGTQAAGMVKCPHCAAMLREV